jgi:Trk K+ transport system NAD-binding subunit
MDQPVILCGLGRVGWRVLEYLQTIGLSVVVVDSHADHNDPRLSRVLVVRGDCRHPDTLRQAGVADARGVLILTSDDLVNISTTLMVRHLNPTVRIVMRMFNQNLITRLGKAVNNVFALSTSTLAAPVMALTALTGQALGTFRIEGVPDGRRQVAEIHIGPNSLLRNQTLAGVSARYDFQVVGLFPGSGQPPALLLDVDHGAVLNEGDRLVVCGDPRILSPLLAQAGESGAEVLWGGWLRLLGRMAWRFLDEMDLALKVSTGILLVVVLVSALIFHFAVEREGLTDALYHTIGLIVNGDQLGLEPGSAWVKVFVSVLRLLGAAFTAAFTAIVTNYLLRARLGGALEVRRIPESGHVVVCGLGNVGFRVVEELLSYGERVVVLELARDSRFVTTARRLGVPVIHGDATVREVLRQANGPTARAIVAATSNDLINLEVALMARELNAGQRVVLRLSDPALAQTLREAADIHLALSVPVLAAPAFVASLLGDRVQSVFFLGERLLTVIDLMIGPEDTEVVNQTVRAVAVDHRLLPVAVVGPDGTLQRQPLTARLTPGCRMTAIVTLPDLERMMQQLPVPKGFAVDVTSVTLPAKEWVTLLLRTQKGLNQEDATQALENLPVCLGDHLTRGQAEDLLALLARERVAARLRPV